jgi:hypothetical protein
MRQYYDNLVRDAVVYGAKKAEPKVALFYNSATAFNSPLVHAVSGAYLLRPDGKYARQGSADERLFYQVMTNAGWADGAGYGGGPNGKDAAKLFFYSAEEFESVRPHFETVHRAN